MKLVADLDGSILKALFFLGPCGMFFTPFAGIGSLRTFYFLVAAVNLLAFIRLRPKDLPQHGLIALIACIAACSALYGYTRYDPAQGIALNPLVRFLVLLNLLWGFYNISILLASRSGEYLLGLIGVSYKGFLTVLLAGGLLYVMYVTGRGAPALYSRVVSLEQEAYGYVRFSPGTYPNEFGIICSFFSMLSICLYGRSFKRRYVLFFLLSVAGMFLASTRAAYITAALGLLTILIAYPSRRARGAFALLSLLSVPLLLVALSYLSFDVLGVIRSGYEALVSGRGSSAQRAQDWTRALREFYDHYAFGSGFESLEASQLHNVPLQLLYGLGLLPFFAIATLAVLFFWVQWRGRLSAIHFADAFDLRYASLLRWILLQHVLVFALTNHNQAHFFTWLLFLLACLRFTLAPSPRGAGVALKQDLPTRIGAPQPGLS